MKHQATTVIRDFAQEFEWCTQNVGMAEKGTKVRLVLVLNLDTLRCLYLYVTMQVGNEMAHLETIQDRLHCIPYI